MKHVVHIDGIKNKVGTFHQVVRANGFLFLSSQLSCDLKTGAIIPGDIRVQTQRTMENIRFLIESCGGTMDDIVKATIYMGDIAFREAINAIYVQFFTPGSEPAKVSMQAVSPLPSIDVEIDVVAIAR